MIEICVQKRLNAAHGDMWLNLDCEIEQGKLITLFGKSGAGKTSTIRILAGLMSPDHGYIKVNGQTWFHKSQKINLRPQKRKIGFVFQDYALFPNMTVRENLTFALEKKQIHKIVDELIEVVELGDLQHKKPHNLSGGQKQRVALARALVQKPQVLMLDEPLSALDLEMRKKLQSYILSVHNSYNLTTFLISHDVSEIESMSDEVLVLSNGEIINQGPPTEIFKQANAKHTTKLAGEIINIKALPYSRLITLTFATGQMDFELPKTESEHLLIGDMLEVNIGIDTKIQQHKVI